MPLLNEKYNQIKPTIDYLADPVVLAQAWKKSHSYIRSHNWYADSLELDCSALNLEGDIERWSNELAAFKYRPTPMRLVPAPKTDTWAFIEKNENWSWEPIGIGRDTTSSADNDDMRSGPLRPLAHLTIKDQTVATAIMLCLADAIETAQGPVSGGRASGTSSYGNRLHCKWEKGRANFRWGNSGTYSKYFQDYELFLKRTGERAADLVSNFSSVQKPRKVYEVQLDMAAFYDNIDRNLLIAKLKGYASKFEYFENIYDEAFWENVRRCIEGWRWNKQDRKLECCLKLPLEDKGLPQGLVASGFFANAYLIELDAKCQALVISSETGFAIGNAAHESSTIVVHDYCRYVDDLRLVVSTDGEISEEELKAELATSIQRLLPPGLILNQDKTKLILFTGKTAEISSRMQSIQTIASGPMDMATLEQMTDSLNNLFTLAETSQSTGPEPKNCPLPLANVRPPVLDVREDDLLEIV